MTLPPGYSHATALAVGMSKCCSASKKSLCDFDDLPGVANSVNLMSDLWRQRKFSERSVFKVGVSGRQ